jgi:hypothetical protein
MTPTFAVHDPEIQVLVMPHLCPQVPQLEVSLLRFVQPPPQQVAVSPEQICPHEPQLPLLMDRFTQVPPQFVPPQRKQAFERPPIRVGPELTEEVVVVVTAAVVVDVVGAAVVASVGTLEQVDALQIMPVGHIFPQMPQLLALDASS